MMTLEEALAIHAATPTILGETTWTVERQRGITGSYIHGYPPCWVMDRRRERIVATHPTGVRVVSLQISDALLKSRVALGAGWLYMQELVVIMRHTLIHEVWKLTSARNLGLS